MSSRKKDIAQAVLYVVKNIAANESKFNITKPEHEIGTKNLLKQINSKIDETFNYDSFYIDVYGDI